MPRLTAEEVEMVYPKLVIRDAAGEIQGLRYDELAPLLLEQMQQHETRAVAQDVTVRELKKQVAELSELRQELRSALHELRSDRELFAKR